MMCISPYRYARPSSSEPPIADVFNPILRVEKEISDKSLKDLKLYEDPFTTSVLKALRKADVQNIPYNSKEESIVRSVMLDDVEFDDAYSTMRSTIYIRKFYPTLLDLLLKHKRTILTGNPGISKSWFHWYILYCMFNANEKQEVKVPKVIARQIAKEDLIFMFPEHCKAFCTPNVNLGLRFLKRNIQPDAALLLIEPQASLDEPLLSDIQTILTCSPDRRRYHEFAKNGAIMYYMPVWQLDELQVVAGHIRANAKDEFLKSAVSPKKIEERYSRFGGIFRHVIPRSEEALEDAEREQRLVLARAKPTDTLIFGSNIEKRDDLKENISHYLLQYSVNQENFRSFEMVIASEYVRVKLNEDDPNDTELHESIDALNSMFLGNKSQMPALFEYVLYHMLLKGSFKWTRLDDDLNEHEIDLKFTSGKFVSKDEEDVLKDMQPGILYRPCASTFPAVDMLWVEENEPGKRVYYAIQVTFAESHAKPTSAYVKLGRHLGLEKKDELIVYFITNPSYAHLYARREKEQFFKKSPKDISYNIEFASIIVDNFRVVTLRKKW